MVDEFSLGYILIITISLSLFRSMGLSRHDLSDHPPFGFKSCMFPHKWSIDSTYIQMISHFTSIYDDILNSEYIYIHMWDKSMSLVSYEFDKENRD